MRVNPSTKSRKSRGQVGVKKGLSVSFHPRRSMYAYVSLPAVTRRGAYWSLGVSMIHSLEGTKRRPLFCDSWYKCLHGPRLQPPQSNYVKMPRPSILWVDPRRRGEGPGTGTGGPPLHLNHSSGDSPAIVSSFAPNCSVGGRAGRGSPFPSSSVTSRSRCVGHGDPGGPPAHRRPTPAMRQRPTWPRRA